MSFVRKLELRRNLSLYYVSRTSGLKFYAYLLVSADQSKEFEQAIASGSYNLGEYGHILEYRIGVNEPPEQLKQEVLEFIKEFSI